ncbi:MAG TPA: bifunctional DNA-binding transcriptional regulator/O6-methylguanine-DNA methyltransferase Ada [Thermoanaerobaculia bacterium]|nr:bifunctional DNA-binding transcriptional regulator/O6-methylguanine-DNA methyltransferase Ada [Thermoanaerobaculia bacterium]
MNKTGTAAAAGSSPGALASGMPIPDHAWEAVLARDRGSDGSFVFAVASTRVYCRPSCPGRHPHRERVALYATPEAAEQAGFRPCKRCRPQSQEAPRAEQSVARALAYLEGHLDETVTLVHLGRLVGMSPTHLQRTFKRETGLTPKEYVQALRVERLKARLKKGDDVTTATYEAGYGAGSRLYEQSDARLGMTPGTFKRGGLGMRIQYTIVASPLGRLLVGFTERGVCAVRLGDSDRELAQGLWTEYPRAFLERQDEGGDWVQAIVDSLGGAPDPLRLPLDVRGTAFEWRVWKALTEIPRGSTRSYGEVASAIGAPTAARAVARACAANRVAVVIPCHRVVRADGGLGGYRWGVERKRQLLAAERESPDPARADA